jgi:cytosine/adenosine deaminase-related metal-dependent hydrolase
VTDAFEDRYALGVPDEVAEERPAIERRDVAPARAPAAPFALRGCVLTPTARIDDGYVVVSGPAIASVGSAKPDGVKVFETGGVILPGLIDLHGHPEYNVFAAWEPPKLFKNRYAWRRSDEYKAIVREPWARLTDAHDSLLRDLTRYAETRALVGGVTAVQGASAKYPDKEEALVRNVDLRIFGGHKARSIIDLGRTDEEDRKRYRKQIDDGDVTALYVHLAEGVDDSSRQELDELVEARLLTEATVIIHGTALSADQLADVKDAGAKMVWSPQSNLRLYAQTTAAAEALRLGIPMGLGADWLPSGSQSLLGELKVARRQLQLQRTSLSPAQLAKKLVQMVTSDAAEIAGLGDRLGKLDEGRLADVLVLERHVEDPWVNVVEAEPSWVQLVTIGGDLAYGAKAWVDELGSPGEAEDVIAWGKPMTLDTSYAAASGDSPPIRLGEIRARLLDRYPQTGPIFA